MTTDDFERRLRDALYSEAERIRPHDRRTEILAMAHDEKRAVSPARRWLVPAAAAASVALIGIVIWGASGGGGTPQAAPASPAASATGQLAAGIPSGPVSGATTQVRLPAYFVGATSVANNQFGLYREFVPTSVPVKATPAQKAQAAVTVAMDAKRLSSVEPYLQPWAGTSVTAVTVTASQITITLSGPGAGGLTPAQSRLAVQQLVWTAQAAIGQGTIPVKFVVAGSSKLFGTYDTAQTYNRPASGLEYQVLAPIWITSPVRDQVLPAGAPVVASGQSCAFEATTRWKLLNNTSRSVVKSGVATATSGCPTRGTWQVRLGVLPTGGYAFVMSELSMKDGSVIAEALRNFTVR